MVMTLEQFQSQILEKFPDANWNFFKLSDHPSENWEFLEPLDDLLVALVGDMFITYGERPYGDGWEIYTPHAGTQYGESLDEVDEEYLRTQESL
jgi:hypothetical protein